MSEEEKSRSIELEDMFVITPAFKAIYSSINYEYPDTVSHSVSKTYISANEPPMSKEQLKRYLLENKVLNEMEESDEGLGSWR